MKADVCLMFELIHIIGEGVFTIGHTAVAVELKVVRPVAHLLTQTPSVAHEHNQVYVDFILKLLSTSETVTC